MCNYNNAMIACVCVCVCVCINTRFCIFLSFAIISDRQGHRDKQELFDVIKFYENTPPAAGK
jgi:hypothetical protein